MAVKANSAFSRIVKLGVFDKVPTGVLFTLLHTVANSNDNGIVIMNITGLTEITGRTRKTIAKDINLLEDMSYNGKPLLKRVIALVDGKETEVIKINDVFLTNISTNDSKTVDAMPFIEEISNHRFTAKDIVNLFTKLYQQEFGTRYISNETRDIAVIKKGLLGAFSDDELTEVIKVAIKDYTKLWATFEYPRPSIRMLSRWLAKRAAAVIAQRRKEARILMQHSEQRESTQRIAQDKLKALFGE